MSQLNLMINDDLQVKIDGTPYMYHCTIMIIHIMFWFSKTYILADRI